MLASPRLPAPIAGQATARQPRLNSTRLTAGIIDHGEVPSISALAKRLNQHISYVSRLVRFALLAPDLVEAILDGNEPSGLSMAKLRKGIPEIWAEQRKQFGQIE